MTQDAQREPRPAGAEALFGDQLPKVDKYVDLLATTGIEWGLIGPRELPRLWTRHVLNCAPVAELITEGETVADLGSGAGLPGLIIALRRPELKVTLIEPLARRVEWLGETVSSLGLTNVSVVRARAEELVDREIFGVVTSRAVKALPGLATWTAPLVSPGGRMLAIKGESAEAELAGAERMLKRVGLGHGRVHVLGMDSQETPTRVIELERL